MYDDVLSPLFTPHTSVSVFISSSSASSFHFHYRSRVNGDGMAALGDDGGVGDILRLLPVRCVASFWNLRLRFSAGGRRAVFGPEGLCSAGLYTRPPFA